MNIKELQKTYRGLATLLILTISLFSLQSTCFAEIFEESAEEYRLKGYEEQKNGNLGKALSYYSKAISLGLKEPVVFNDLGVVYEQLGVVDKALEFYLKAIQANPEYQPAYTNIAYLYLERGDIENATLFFRQRIKKAPKDDPWVARIQQELLKIDPEYKEAFINRQLDEKRRQLEERKKKVQDEFMLGIIRSDKHYQRGLQLLTEKKFDEAVNEFDRALEITPNNPKILKIKQRTFFEKEIDAVKGKAERAIEKLESGELESARKEFQEVLAKRTYSIIFKR